MGDALILERLENDLRAGHPILRHRTASKFLAPRVFPGDIPAETHADGRVFGRAAGEKS
jgi:hypothetical protein